MLLVKITGASLSILLPVVNLPFVAIGYRQMGRAFAIRSTLGIGGLAAALAVVPYPDVTPDLLLTAVFGGFFLGAGIGLAVRGGAVLGVEPALYSILTYLAAARTVDFVIYGIEEYTAITIISGESDAIRERIINELDRGVTIYKGHGGMSGVEQNILYCVVTRLEIGGVKSIVRALDENAFVVSHPVADVDGGVIKRGALH
jgi:uncharacterized membrane-anchored protein YitT (DUF2179 family)